MFSRILIPLDGSLLAEQVLATGERLRARGSVLHLIRVNPAPSNPATPYDETLQVEAESYLDFMVTRLADRGVSAQWETRCGDVAQEVLVAARDHGCDLIAIASHGRSGMARLVFGSVAEKILRGAEIPTLFVRSIDAAAKERKLECILVPTDGTAVSERAIEPAALLAREHGARLHLLFVIESLWAAGDSKLAREQLREVRRVSDGLKQRAAALRNEDIHARALVVRGDASDEVLAHAARYGADLIVMTPTGTTHRPHAFGHVSEKVLRTASMPVLVVRGSAQ